MSPEPVIESHELITGRLWRLGVADPEQKKRRAVVFVHGFTGNAEDTWRADGAADSFPQLLAKDPLFQDFDIFLFQYATGFFFPPEIDNIVRQLDFAFKAHLEDLSVVFVAHSMGGLVCMRYVLNRLKNAAPLRVNGLLTYGTPMSGVEWVKYAGVALQATAIKIPVISWIAKFFTSNRQLENMRAGGEFIDQLSSEWVLRVLNGGYPSIPPNLRTWLPTRVVSGNEDWVVKESSARGFYRDIDWIPVQKGHIEMIKPTSRKDECYQIASNFLRQSREWIGQESALKLREQADFIWNLHQSRRIAKWKFDFSFHGREAANGSPFGLPGFGVFAVQECSYTRFIDGPVLKFGFAFGSIATDNVWSDEFVFLHRITFRGLSNAETGKIVSALRQLLPDPVGAWQKLFNELKVTIGTGKESVKLNPGAPFAVNDGIVCEFAVPQQLIGKDERVKLSFQSMVPLNIRHYRIAFPWLCESFSTTVTFEREVAFLATSQAMRGSVEAEHTEEGSGKINLRSEELVLPDSYILIEWRFNEEVSK